MTKILAVDDDPATLLQIKEIITSLGYSSGILAKPELMFERLEAEVFDLILMDVYMPGIDGVSLLKQLNAHPDYHRIPVIMLTGERSEHLLAESFKCGAKDYILKPIEEVIFTARLQSALETKFHQDHLLKTMEELKQANEAAQLGMQAKDHFIANVSHEIRTPLTVVREYIHMMLLQTEKLSKEQMISYLNRAYAAAYNLADLVDNILDFSQLESGVIHLNSEAIPLKALFSEIQEDLIVLAQKEDKTLTFHVAEELPQIYADQKKLKQVLFNLIGNAIKFTKANDQITVGAEVNNDLIQIYVQDTGIGIPLDFQDKVFDRFTRSENSGSVKGTGIGLTIAKQLLEAMSGSIWFETHPGKGTTFYFTLPQANQT